MAKTTHTHRGHCQICGKLHAADNVTGKLAAHGYEIPAHWHQRTASCYGAVALPFEKSRDLIPGVIKGLRNEADRLIAHAAKVRAEGITGLDLSHGGTGGTVARLESGELVFRSWRSANRAERDAGDKAKKMTKQETVAEYFATWGRTDAENQETAARWFAEACERVAAGCEYNAGKCNADADTFQRRFDSWIADAPLVPVESEDNVITGYKSRRGPNWSNEYLVYPVNAAGKKCGATIYCQGYKAANAKLAELTAALAK